jgi:hypothetical protein
LAKVESLALAIFSRSRSALAWAALSDLPAPAFPPLLPGKKNLFMDWN